MKSSASDPRSAVLGLAMAGVMTLGTLASAQDIVPDSMSTNPPMAVLSEADVRTQLNAQGYISIKNLALADGTWNADVAKADGNSLKIHIDAKTGNSFSDGTPRRLNVTEIEGALASAGYTKVRGLKMEGNFWQASADDANGKSAEVRIDPTSGKVFIPEPTK